MKARAFRTSEYSPMVQALSGYILGYSRNSCWKVLVEIGASSFVSQKTYSDERAARAAAQRLMSRVKP